MKTFAILLLATLSQSAQAEKCFSRPSALDGGGGGYAVKLVTREAENHLIVVSLNAEVKQTLAEAEREKAKICLEGTSTDNYFYAFGARKK